MRANLLHDNLKPNFFEDLFPYSQFPRLTFDDEVVPMELPESIWVTDTTFRDGQQAGWSFSSEQVLRIFDYLHMIDGGTGLIRQSEFFLYSEYDRQTVATCQDRGYRYPEIVGWIRAKTSDLDLVTRVDCIKVGILASVSDYHIVKKLGQTRAQAKRTYLDVIHQALDRGMRPQCHLEDITRADIEGFVLPLVESLMALSEDTGIPIPIRLCDTLGLGIPFPQAIQPRGIPKLIHRLRTIGVPPEQLEWHGHNDFHMGAVNAVSAWLYGCAAVNCSICGVGERSGNPPLEALLIEHAQLKGMQSSVDYGALSELADYARLELGFDIPVNYPLVGEETNLTRAGIHVDGLMKHESVYSAYDSGMLLRRPPQVAITNRSGLAGIMHWIKTHFHADIPKHDPRLSHIKERIDEHFRSCQTSRISDNDMRNWVLKTFAEEDLEPLSK